MELIVTIIRLKMYKHINIGENICQRSGFNETQKGIYFFTKFFWTISFIYWILLFELSACFENLIKKQPSGQMNFVALHDNPEVRSGINEYDSEIIEEVENNEDEKVYL